MNFIELNLILIRTTMYIKHNETIALLVDSTFRIDAIHLEYHCRIVLHSHEVISPAAPYYLQVQWEVHVVYLIPTPVFLLLLFESTHLSYWPTYVVLLPQIIQLPFITSRQEYFIFHVHFIILKVHPFFYLTHYIYPYFILIFIYTFYYVLESFSYSVIL